MKNSGDSEFGFTLVELSIALVIIGLLISAIIYLGASTLGSSKVAKTISIVSDLSNAIAQFKSQYKDLPGDINVNAVTPEIAGLPAGCIASGNGDGLIGGTYDGGGGLTGGEAICVPEHLYHAGMIRTDGIDGVTGMLVINTPYGEVNLVSKANSHASGIANFANRNITNVIELTNLPCEVVIELDSKLDNNNISNGKSVAANLDGSVRAACNKNDIIPFFVISL